MTWEPVTSYGVHYATGSHLPSTADTAVLMSPPGPWVEYDRNDNHRREWTQ